MDDIFFEDEAEKIIHLNEMARLQESFKTVNSDTLLAETKLPIARVKRRNHQQKARI